MKKTLRLILTVICLIAVTALFASCDELINILESSIITDPDTSNITPHSTAEPFCETAEEQSEEETETEEPVQKPPEPFVDTFVPGNGVKTVYIDKNAKEPLRYFKNTLENEAETAAYESLEAMLKSFDTAAKITKKISFEDVKPVCLKFSLDYPEFCYAKTSYHATGYTNNIDQVIFYGDNSKATAARMKNEVDNAVKKIIASIPDGSTDFEAELIIYDWLCDNVTYSLSAAEPYTMYGALVNKECVCEGYAEAFQYICGKIGIKVITMLGIADNSSVAENHKWCAVQIGGKWYAVDPTWGADKEADRYLYFNNSAYLQSNHFPDDRISGLLPDMSSEDASYFSYYGLQFDDNTFDETFLRALSHYKERFLSKSVTAKILIRSKDGTAEKYADMINEEPERITDLMRRFNYYSDRELVIYGEAEVVNGDTVVFTVCKI